MKNIEEIRAKLGPDYRVEENDGVITVCSIWDGVEYVRCIQSRKGGISGSEIFEGKIYKVKGWANEYVMLISGFEIGWEPDGVFTPATEDEYVEQLKSEAYKRFGDIKEGDRFDLTDIGGMSYVGIKLKGSPTFVYIKREDELFLNGYRLYRKGKWAKKIEERVKVEVEDWKTTTNAEFKSFDFRVEMRVESSRPFDPNESAVYLAKCLKEYLNKS